jgi:hypothetical protein
VSRILGIFGSFLGCTALLTWGAATLVGPEAFRRGVDLYRYRRTYDRILRAPSHRKRPRLVWLGDSTIMGLKHPSYPQLLLPRLRRRGIDSRVVTGPAFDPYVYYFLAGAVVERLDPSVVVIVARLPTFDPKGSNRFFRYNDLSSYLPASLLPRTFLLRLAPRQLSPARLLLAQTLKNETAERIFYTAEGLRTLYAEAPFWEVMGPPKNPPTFNPAIRSMLDEHARPVSRRQPGVAMLEATVRVLSEAGCVVLVVASPIPLEAMRVIRGIDPAVIQRNFYALRDIVEEAGGTLVDLHALLPPSELADYAGHFKPAGALHVSQVVFPSVRDALKRAGAWRASSTPVRAEG